MNRDPDALFKINEEVEAQMARQGLLSRRQRLIGELATELGTDSRSHSNRYPLSEAIQPMFQALTEQINNLITSARRKVKQNQVLLQGFRKWLRNCCMQSRQKVVYQKPMRRGDLSIADIKAPLEDHRLIPQSNFSTYHVWTY